MSFGSQKLVHTDGTMHHLGIDAVTPRVILVPDPQEVPLYAALLEGPVQQGCYREYATWRGIWRGEPLTVMSCGFGCMPMAIAVEELHHLGAESLIKIAACPAIQPELEPGTLLAASGAVRGEGATREYTDPSYPAVADMPLLGALLSQIIALIYGLPASFFNGNFIARLIAGFWLAVMLGIYLAKIEVDIRSGGKSPLDILFAFVGSYSRSKELEANLREWTDRYRLVLENAGEMIVMLTSDGRIIDANFSAARLLGSANPGELTNRRLFPRMRVLDRPGLTLGAELDGPVRFQCRLDEKSPESKLLSCSLSPMRIRGQLLLVLIGRDVTEESKLAEEKARLAEQLVHSQRIEALGMLAGGIAHDFNNYIHAILGHIDVINYLHQPDDPEVLNHLEKISTIAEQAGHLTSQLLGFARKGKYQVTDLDLRQLLENSLGLLGPRKQRDLSVSVDVPDDLKPVRADSLQLQQVMLNLMINAIDAMANNKGEQILTITAGPADASPVPLEPPPERAGINPADYLFIRVSDNGCGMTEATQRKLFEPFFTTKPVGKGTGMGLAMVYGTVTNHQGWIQLESAPGVGTTFYLFLPAGQGKVKS